eukprot:scaffold6927_cov30-Phaeocystis_antarctica.AAC.1
MAARRGDNQREMVTAERRDLEREMRREIPRDLDESGANLVGYARESGGNTSDGEGGEGEQAAHQI